MAHTTQSSPFLKAAETADNEILKGVLVCAHEQLAGTNPAVESTEIISRAISLALANVGADILMKIRPESAVTENPNPREEACIFAYLYLLTLLLNTYLQDYTGISPAVATESATASCTNFLPFATADFRLKVTERGMPVFKQVTSENSKEAEEFNDMVQKALLAYILSYVKPDIPKETGIRLVTGMFRTMCSLVKTV